ncbi:MAG: K(+)-transporting ATPase subunit C [Acidobacteria bacterium]|nr:K(+)-transporting ATPase subunit C [Acidobacteriota bacterium]MBV9068105.1 K(+)-transporting ATPase subunit C [Acidobacteriota bacterium]MBV9185412.1 K(+)-transporting ATPase subunit C [Acidobacteriota bacterium]
MFEHVKISIRITIVLLVITCGLYPLTVWAIGQTFFRDKANGSLILRNGTVIGSSLIGQHFAGARFFHGRPSSSNYDPSASGGTNWGPTSAKLRDAVAQRTAHYNDTKPAAGIPADAVTASCSGVDPHISVANAESQAARVARENSLPPPQVAALIRRHTEGRFLGIYGEPRVNVLLLNLDLMNAAAK